MRIVGGEFKGRRLAVPAGQSIRPTTDRTRESLFNILVHQFKENLVDGRVLDVFAGTGALGLEALSRGAEFVTFIEKNAEGARLIQQNIKALAVENRTQLLRGDASKPLVKGGSVAYDLVLMDPPYAKSLGQAAVHQLHVGGWLKQGAVLVLEERSGSLPPALEFFETVDKRSFGDTEIGFFCYTPPNAI